MKIFLLLLINLISINQIFASNDIKINALLTRYNVKVDLDKLIIINNSNGVSFETKGNIIRKDFLTEVEDEKTISFEAKLIKISDKNYFVSFPQQDHIRLQIYDYKGELVFDENTNNQYDIKLHFNGIYFLVASNGKEILKKVINTYLIENSTISNESSIKKPVTYTFIGIKNPLEFGAKNAFLPDTIANIELDTCKELNFNILEVSKFNYIKGGIIKFKNLSLKRSSSVDIRSYNDTLKQKRNTDTIQKDTSYIFKSNFSEYYVRPQTVGISSIRPVYCSDFASNDSLLTFCHANTKTFNDPPFYNLGYELLLNNIFFKIQDSLITNIKIENKFDARYPSGSIYDSKSSQNENISIDSLKLNLVNSKKFTFSIYKNLIYSNNYSDSSSSSHWDSSSSGYSEFLIFDNNEIEVTLEFYE